MASQKRRFFAPEERILWVRFDTKAAGSLGLLCLDARPDAAKRPCEHKKMPLVSQLFLCLSRACLGKRSRLSYKRIGVDHNHKACVSCILVHTFVARRRDQHDVTHRCVAVESDVHCAVRVEGRGGRKIQAPAGVIHLNLLRGIVS